MVRDCSSINIICSSIMLIMIIYFIKLHIRKHIKTKFLSILPNIFHGEFKYRITYSFPIINWSKLKSKCLLNTTLYSLFIRTHLIYSKAPQYPCQALNWDYAEFETVEIATFNSAKLSICDVQNWLIFCLIKKTLCLLF